MARNERSWTYEEDRFVTARELADRWQVKPQRLANERSKGYGPPFIKIGSSVRYRISDVLQFEEANLRNLVGR